MTFHSPFIVQVKSSSKKKISYGGIDKKSKWKKEEIDWLFNQELPLLIGIVDRKCLKLNLYSTSNMWGARNSGGNIGEVILVPDKLDKNSGDVPAPNHISMSNWPRGIGDGKRWNVPLGHPLVSIPIDDLESGTKIEKFRVILLRALKIEQENITYRRLQVHWSKWPHRYETNKIGNFVYGFFYAGSTTPGANTNEQLKSLTPIVAMLAYNFKAQRKFTEIDKLKPIVELIPDSDELRVLKKEVPELFN